MYLHTYRNAVAITCRYLNNGLYLLHVYGIPQDAIDTPKRIMYNHIKVIQENLTLRPLPLCGAQGIILSLLD